MIISRVKVLVLSMDKDISLFPTHSLASCLYPIPPSSFSILTSSSQKLRKRFTKVNDHRKPHPFTSLDYSLIGFSLHCPGARKIPELKKAILDHVESYEGPALPHWPHFSPIP